MVIVIYNTDQILNIGSDVTGIKKRKDDLMKKLNYLGLNEEEQFEVNQIIREYKIQNYTKNLNHPVHYGKEDRIHYLAKCNIGFLLKQKGYNYLCEKKVSGKNNESNIPDILVLKPLVAIEILNSEKQESFERKVQKAANGIFFISIHANDAIKMEDLGGLI